MFPIYVSPSTSIFDHLERLVFIMFQKTDWEIDDN